MTHAEAYAAMMKTHATTGEYVDPISGKTFPLGNVMKEHPNREERRRLDRWRYSGAIARKSHGRW
jgi:hypothetical protein